jgi:hypothetical protein
MPAVELADHRGKTSRCGSSSDMRKFRYRYALNLIVVLLVDILFLIDGSTHYASS